MKTKVEDIEIGSGKQDSKKGIVTSSNQHGNNNSSISPPGDTNNKIPPPNKSGEDSKDTDLESKKRKSQTSSSDKVINTDRKEEDDPDIVEEITRIGHCAKLRHNFCFKTFIFFVVMALNAVDMIADWLLFRDIFQIQEGLVYGPPDNAITYSLLTFSIIGTFTFVFEVVNLWWEIYRKNPWINADLASAVTIWIEDIPQIIINLFIALCREEAISYFQLVKASVIIASIIIRIIVSLIHYCSKKNLAELNDHTKTSCRHVTYRFFIMIGLLGIFSCSVAVFFLTQFERTEDGNIKFNLPKSVFEGQYNEERYFKNVSIYLHHPLIGFDNGNVDSNDVNWIRLISLYDVRKKDTEIFKLEYDQTRTKIVIWQTNHSGTLVVNDCYTLDRTAKTVTRASSCVSHITGQKSAFIFKFEFVKKKIPTLIFGDVRFNLIVKENGVCHGPSTSLVTKLRDRRDKTTNQIHPVIHYYRTNNVAEDHHLLWTSGASGARFYKNQADLIDIATVWRTGFNYCDSTGSLAPHIYTGIDVDCNI
ncbi:uncharacterized protein LOC132552517 [Ylistrum balloti]|uniref:uncharacterized protein LOC132552517 n=1 Tax=Ylistrum balloti TaxID=509963 RepID=UPI00290588C3|nr:uncharacterized protein LOC132552517 [Ylistrum balloti]